MDKKNNVLILNDCMDIVDGFNTCTVGNHKKKLRMMKYLKGGFSSVSYKKQFRKSLIGKRYNPFSM